MLISENILIIKKSKFIGLLYKIDNEKEVKTILDNLKKEHPKARHFPYAYIVGPKMGKTDDKEPHNTAGMPLFNLLQYHNLDSHLLVVVRYFGGTKLGASNLLRAYNTCAKDTINKIKSL